MVETPNKDRPIDQDPTEVKRGRGWWKPFLLITAVIALLFLAKVLGLDKRLGDLKDWIKGLGWLGYIVFVLLYIVATVAAIPGTALTAMAGVLFGTVLGVTLVSIGSTAGASLAFLVARYFARGSISKLLEKNAKFKKLDALTGKQGAIIVAITRLVPLFPFNLLNYGFGLTKVRLVTYTFWSWVCMLPGTILYVAGSDAIATGFSEGKVPWGVIGAIAGIIVLLAIIVPLSRRRLKRDEDSAEGKKSVDVQ